MHALPSPSNIATPGAIYTIPAPAALPSFLACGDMTEPQMRKLNRVFLLEDNDANAMVFEAFLEMAGCMSLDRAETMEEAQHYIGGITSGRYDLVVIDIMLGDGESTPFARKIAPFAACPIAAYTAKTATKDIALYGSVGISHVFAKPLSRENFEAGLSLMDLG